MWREIAEVRARLKSDALAARIDTNHATLLTTRQLTKAAAAPRAPRRPRSAGPSIMEERLLDLDERLWGIARSMRGWRKLSALQRAHAARAFPRPKVVDLAALEAAETRLADQAWYRLGSGGEDAVERLLSPWRAIRSARAVVLSRLRRRVRGAADALDDLDAEIVSVATTMRIEKQLVDVHRLHVESHRLHGKYLAARVLLGLMREAEQNVPAILAGRVPAAVLPAYAALVTAAAGQHHPSGATFRRLRDRAFLRAYADRIEGVARALNRSHNAVEAAVTSGGVQALVGSNIARAARLVLQVLRIANTRTAQRRFASSGASRNS